MNRLQSELQRLYLPQASAGQGTEPDESRLIDADGRVRAMVLERARPADWAVLSKVWRGVQADLDLPAPAIAVSGTDGVQLWFSLAQPLPAAQAWAFMEALRQRYLGDIRTHRVGLLPTVDAASLSQAVHARQVPAPQADSGHWSAFVAPDLAPVFADEPWLDLPPNLDGQAALLAGLASMPIAEVERALAQLQLAALPVPSSPTSASAVAAHADVGTVNLRAPSSGPWLDPKRFLLDVMNDDAVALALRIEAAKALLPGFDGARRENGDR